MTERQDMIAAGLGISEGESKPIVVGPIKETMFSRSNIRHCLKEFKAIEKDALMMNPAAFLQTCKNAHYEKDEPNTKPYVDRTIRFKSKALVDNKVYVVGFIVHHNFKDGQYHLHHVSVYDEK